mmetsp:Transcript_115184/g.229437  ORF Transcript_115184/g.229437 Transcript_115184/m.229437 type:complete len:205 (+) Transcript_115184:61-675(+)
MIAGCFKVGHADASTVSAAGDASLTPAQPLSKETFNIVLLSGESVDIDLSNVTRVPELRQAVAEYFKVSQAKVQLMQGGQVFGRDSAMTLEPKNGQVTVVLQMVDLSQVRLKHDSQSECDEGTGYVSHHSELYYDDVKIWSKHTSYSCNVGGARGSSHQATLSEDKATLTVEETVETRHVGQPPSKSEWVTLSVEQLILEAQNK